MKKKLFLLIPILFSPFQSTVSPAAAAADSRANSDSTATPKFFHLPPISQETLYGAEAVRSQSCHAPPFDFYEDTAEAALVSAVEKSATANGLLSTDAIGYLKMLVDFYVAREKYSEAEKYLLKQIEIYQHNGGFNRQQCRAVMQLACIAILQNSRASAEEWLSKAKTLSSSNDDDLDCAAISLELGDTKQCVDILTKTAAVLRNQSALDVMGNSFWKCCYLLSETGQDAQLKLMDSVYDEARKKFPSGVRLGGYWSEPSEEPTYARKNGAWIRETRSTRMAYRALPMKKLPSPLDVQIQGMKQQLEFLKRSAPPAVAKFQIPSLERNIALAEEQSKGQRVLELSSQLQGPLKDYATARFRALQEAETDRKLRSAARSKTKLEQ